jgi:hypothetical protein
VRQLQPAFANASVEFNRRIARRERRRPG